MLKGLEITIYNKSEILIDNDEFRIDSEYYQKQYLKLYKQLEHSPMLGSLTYMSDLSSNGSFAAVKAIKNDNNPKVIPFIRSGNVGDTFINESDLEFISKEAHLKLPKSTTELHEIMMARKGKIGGASIITEEEVNFNCSENVIKLRVLEKDKLNPFYFTSYFNSKYGLKQVERLATGNVQPWVSIFQIKKLMIPILNINFQTEIERLILKSQSNINESNQLYSKAENLLLKEIGLQNFELSEESVNIKNFKDTFGKTGRLDAEFYKKKYEQINTVIKNNNGVKIKNLSNSIAGYAFSSKNYKNEGIPIIRIQNITGNFLNTERNPVYWSENDIDEDFLIERGNVLMAMTGATIGKCSLNNSRKKLLLNQRVLSLKPNLKMVTPEYLHQVLSSSFFQELIMGSSIGGAQPNISKETIDELLIPVIDYNKQKLITKYREQSFLLKKQSKLLLVIAKRAIEIAIEENENVAVKYIKIETNE